jgi:uncharacterized protein YjbJ (UPF0337 family)
VRRVTANWQLIASTTDDTPHQEKYAMTGRKDEFVGGVKQGLGKMTGDDALEAEGTAQKETGEAKRKMAGAGREVKGNLKKAAGDVLQSPSLKAEGEADKVSGKIERA